MLIEVEESCFLSTLSKGEGKTLFITSINYEDRSLALLDLIAKIENDERLIIRNIMLLSDSYKVGILHHIKQQNIAYAEERYKKFNYQKEVVPYPDNYDPARLKNRIRSWISECDGGLANVIVDISALPRPIVIDLAEITDTVITQNAKDEHGDPCKIFVIFTKAESYPALRYPYNLGRIRGHFTRLPVAEVVNKSLQVISVVFPGIQGFESKLLYDDIAHIEGPKYVFVEVSSRNVLTSLFIIRANMTLLKQTNADARYYFSIQDGIKKLVVS